MNKEEDLQYFLVSLEKAVLEMDPHYFQLPVADETEPIYRERVYCYELYHQLRCFLGDAFPYKLSGEVDKAGHPVIRKENKPDFIVHKPGDMENNLVVMEVKSAAGIERKGIDKDLSTLNFFLSDKVKYYRGIILIYGGDGDLLEGVKQKVEKIENPKILVLWHPEAGAALRPIKEKQ